LADWGEALDYYARLAHASPRVRLDTLGTTTLGRPFVMLTISSPETLARLDEYREIQAKLADPRRIEDAAEAERLVREGKTVVLITTSIHSTEVGGAQMPLRLVHRLASAAGPLEREILDNTILLLIPSLNPDGMDLVVDWYESTLGEPWEGSAPPFLYHHYTGHDNNRDWYAFTQRETQLAIRYAHNAWHPQIVHDIHQMGSSGARFFIPPYIDPVEPNVDPLLVAGLNQLGTFMAWEMTRQGKTGVIVNAMYDAWTPGRAYQHYHGGVRILTETASAQLATPVTVTFDSPARGGFDPRRPSWNFPRPWPGGEWRLADVVDYQEAGAVALLTHAARNREAWLRSFLAVGERAVAGWPEWPEAWVIPAAQPNGAGVEELLRILTTGAVEVRRATAPFRAEGRDFAAGDYVIVMRQPYAAFAQTLLEPQRYPDLRLYPGGPPRRPYDVTAHTLPLLLGVEAIAVERLPAAGGPVLTEPLPVPPLLQVPVGPPAEFAAGRPRIGVYRSYAPSMDEGWTRWVLDRYGVAYASLHDAEVRAGGLRDRFDVIVLPSQSPGRIRSGRLPGTVPPEYAGGLGEAGVAALDEFVRAGGTLVALEEASRFAIEALGLPVRDMVAGLSAADFFIPGSILRLDVERESRLAAGMPERTIAWFGDGSTAFEPTGAGVRVAARYGTGNPLLSGWALGAERIAGAAALVEVEHGVGEVVLFGFRPQYRAQSMATFPLLFNAMRLPAPEGERAGR